MSDNIASSLESSRPLSAPSALPSKQLPPTGPKAWRERQPPPPPPPTQQLPRPQPQGHHHQQHHHPNGFRPFSPQFPHRVRNGTHVPHHPAARPFATIGHSAQSGPWRSSENPTPGNRGPGGLQHVRNLSGGHVGRGPLAMPPATLSEPPPVGPRKRTRKPKSVARTPSPRAGVDSRKASSAGLYENMDLIKTLATTVTTNLEQLQIEMTKLCLQSRMVGTSDGVELGRLANEIMGKAYIVVETAKKAIKGLPADDASQVSDDRTSAEAKEPSEVEEPLREVVADQEYVPLSFQIPQETLEAKLGLDDDNADKCWSHTHYTSINGDSIQVDYCKTIEECEKFLPKYLEESVIGFDMEWVIFPKSTSARKNVSMIQVANESSVTLVHIGLMDAPKDDPVDETKLVSPTLRAIIESPKILKVGVNISNDAKRLRDFLLLKPEGIFELSDLHHRVYCAERNIGRIPKKLVALAKLTREHLLLPLDKGPVRNSDWSKPVSEEQARYAAADAYAGLRIFDSLEQKRAKLNPKPARPPCRVIDPLPIPVEGQLEDLVSEEAPELVLTDETASELAEALATTTLKPAPSPSPIVVHADSWLADYRNSHPNARASRSQLRAYAMWHVLNHEVDDICSLWRNPPLKQATVVGYIAEAVRLEKLQYERQRLKTVVGILPVALRRKYEWMID